MYVDELQQAVEVNDRPQFNEERSHPDGGNINECNGQDGKRRRCFHSSVAQNLRSTQLKILWRSLKISPFFKTENMLFHYQQAADGGDLQCGVRHVI